MAKTRLNTKGLKITCQFIAISTNVLKSKAYRSLPSNSVKLLMDLAAQYGGWHSRHTLSKHIKIILQSNLVIKTRQGGRNLASLYALTWRPIDYCKGKLDSYIKPSNILLHIWKQ